MAEKPVSKSVTQTQPKDGNKKRKRQEVEVATTDNHKSNGSEVSSKKKQKKQKKKHNDDVPSKAKQDAKEVDVKEERKEGIDESISKMDGRLLADHILQKARKHKKDLTAIELSDMSVPEHAFCDTSSFQAGRTLDKLPDFLKSFTPTKGFDLSKAPEEKGSPHTIVIAAAGLRAADLVRALRSFQSKEAIVAKLFAKHIKLDEAKQFLQRARVNIGVGTPQRIIDLIEAGSLKTDKLARIVVDCSHIDQKKRGIFDMKEMFFPLLQLLSRSEFKERYNTKDTAGLQILVF